MSSLLEVRDLSVDFSTEGQTVHAVKRISFSIQRGETLALVGESGAGKTVTASSILQLLPYPPASHPSGSIQIEGKELLGAAHDVLRNVRGNRISMIFQEPMTSLNPLHTIEKQVSEGLILHKNMAGEAAHSRTLELLHLVGLYEAGQRAFPGIAVVAGGDNESPRLLVVGRRRPAGCLEEGEEVVAGDGAIIPHVGAPAPGDQFVDGVVGRGALYVTHACSFANGWGRAGNF